MDNLLEILVPLIFAAVYFFGNFLSDKASKSSEKKKRSDGRPDASHSERADEAADAEERQRSIREEIRRKIAERRDGSGSPAPEPPETAEAEPVFRRTEEAPQPLPERSAEAPPKRSDDWHKAERKPETVFSWDDAKSGFEDTLQSQLRQIEETRRKAKALRKKAKTVAPRTSGMASAERRRTGTRVLSGGPVREQLLRPGAARTAFIYGEVFGQPVATREPGPVLSAQR